MWPQETRGGFYLDVLELADQAALAGDQPHAIAAILLYQQLVSAFPNAGRLPGIVQGALLSLIFNRGTSMKEEDRRKEMRAIRDLLSGEPPYDLRAVAAELRKMKRLWANTDVSGLVARREREARMVESAIV